MGRAMKPIYLALLFLLTGLCVAYAIGQGEHDDTTIVRPTHPKAHAATHEAPQDPNHYAESARSFSERTFPVYDKETAKLQRLQHEASLYRDALRNVNSDGTVLVKAHAAEIEGKLSKIERKLYEKESKKKVKSFDFTYKSADPVTRAQFDEPHSSSSSFPRTPSPFPRTSSSSPPSSYFRQSLEDNHQSACLAFYDLKNQEKLQGYLSLADRTKMKIDQVRCKVEKSELFQKFMGGNNPAGRYEGDGHAADEEVVHEGDRLHGVPRAQEGAPDAERIHEPVHRTTRTTVTKTTRHVIKKP